MKKTSGPKKDYTTRQFRRVQKEFLNVQSSKNKIRLPEWSGHVDRIKKVKVKCTLVQAMRLCTGRTAHTGSRGIAVLYRH